MKIRALLCLFAAAAGAAFAQNKTDIDPLAGAISLRAGLAAALVKGDENPEQAMARLRAHASPSGLKVDRDADFALAAIDVGLRLLAAQKPAAAEEFFLAAEKALVLAVGETKDEAAQEKALYLQQLAFIRANFLNQAAAAKEDLEAAIRLQPDDAYLKAARKSRDQAELLKAKK